MLTALVVIGLILWFYQCVRNTKKELKRERKELFYIEANDLMFDALTEIAELEHSNECAGCATSLQIARELTEED